MKKTYVTNMPDDIGAFLLASRCFAELGINLCRVSYNKAIDAHNLFIDAGDLDRNRKVQEAVINIKNKFGKDAILKGMNFEKNATTRERNHQIGGHKSGR